MTSPTPGKEKHEPGKCNMTHAVACPQCYPQAYGLAPLEGVTPPTPSGAGEKKENRIGVVFNDANRIDHEDIVCMACNGNRHFMCLKHYEEFAKPIRDDERKLTEDRLLAAAREAERELWVASTVTYMPAAKIDAFNAGLTAMLTSLESVVGK